MIKISVIVPVYNIEPYLDKCLDSLVRQTLNEIQIIVVNDGSKDNSIKIIEEYADKYNDKIINIKKENGGQADARNVGLKYATGEYIGFVDGDDYVDISMFEKMYEIAKNENLDMVECAYYREYKNKLELKNINNYEAKDMLLLTATSVCNKIIKRKILESNKLFFPVGLVYEDLEYVIKMAPHITNIGFIKEPLYYYVQRRGSTCHTFNKRILNIYNVLENILRYYNENNLYEKYKEQLEYIYLKNMLGFSYFNIIRVKDRKLRKQLLRENWKILNEKLPGWKKNSILKNKSSLLNIYYKTINYATYSLYPALLRLVLYMRELKNKI
jgi:glycosyltransferase involved in cell wall biosynthesis